MATTNTFTGASAVPFDTSSQTFKPTIQNNLSMGTVSLNPTSTQSSAQGITIQPNVPATQPVSTITSTTPINLPQSTYQAPVQKALTTNPAADYLNYLASQETPAQQTANSLSQQIFNLVPQLQGQQQELFNQQQLNKVPELKQRLLDVNNQIIQKQAELAQDDTQLIAGISNIEKQAIPMMAITGQQQSLQRDAQIARALKVSEVNMLSAQALAAQGNLTLAEDTASKAVEIKYAPIKEAISLYQQQLDAIQPILSSQEKKQAQLMEFQSKVALNEIDRQQQNEKDISNMIVNAAAQGAPQSLIAKAQKATTSADAAGILGAYAGDYWGTKIKIAQYNKIASANAAAAQAVQAQGLGSNGAQANSQATFLLDTINGALDLADASGRSAALRTAQSWLYGATDYTNLESKVRTIKTNLLTLATDPNIKKFFGPQMSEADVRNMLSAASTLDTEAQTPAQMKAELSRVQDIFQKFAPDYKPAKINLGNWGTGIKSAFTTSTPAAVNFGFTDNQSK